MNSLWIIDVDCDTASQLLIIYSVFVKYLKKKREYNEAVHQLFIAFKKAYYSVSQEVSYNILTECDITMQLVRLKKLLFITFLSVLLIFYLLCYDKCTAHFYVLCIIVTVSISVKIQQKVNKKNRKNGNKK